MYAFLFYACLYKHVNVLKWASRTVAGVFPRLFEMPDKNGITPLEFCKTLDHHECIKYIELRSRPEGEFHVKRLNKAQLAQVSKFYHIIFLPILASITKIEIFSNTTYHITIFLSHLLLNF